ncbi:MAG: hypothetical protein MJK15_21730 [Colwellia sp.]|nr:hypothetical protein [Colwellia sp.]
MKTLIVAVTSCLLLSTIVGAEKGEWVEWLADTQLSYADIENLNLSAFDDDSHQDQTLVLDTVIGRFYQLDGFSRMHIAFEFEAQKHQEFDQMDDIYLGSNFGFRYKFGLGFYQPYLQLNANYGHKEVDYDINSKDIFYTSIELGQHINNRLSLAASIDFTSTDGESGPNVVSELSSDVFSQSFFKASFFADYILAQDWLLSASYARREGDFHSACNTVNVAKVLEVEEVKAITKDKIFVGCVYKLDGSSNIFSASLSYSLTRHSAINLFIERYQGHADVLKYQNTSYSISYNYRY